MTTRRQIIWIGGSLAILIWIAWWSYSNVTERAGGPAASVQSSKPKPEAQTRAAGLQWFGEVPSSAVIREADSRSLGEVVEALTLTRNPADALTAYGIIEGCDLSRPLFDLDPMPPIVLQRKKQCATITDVMRRSRYDYLRVAAYGGAPGVGSFWLRYGPSGDMDALRTRPNDPSAIEWKRQAAALVIRDADGGDFNALQDLMTGYAGKDAIFGADPTRELAYSMAYKQVVDLMDVAGIQNQPTDAELQALAAKLSPEQAAWAKAKAAAIIAARGKRTAGKR